jgi:CDP-diacylglycerol--serine O-phosphatidyltransferase
MPRLKTQAAKDNLLRRVRKQRLKYITILPSLITILNGVCGFAAIVLTSKGPASPVAQFSPFAMAGYLILVAMIADMLDGRLARMSQSTSSFGVQLDSLCDIVSFGVAPAFLMLRILESKLAGFADPSPALASLLHRFIWLTAATYISCAAIRLARFNVENEEDESAHTSFVGLPTPAAAGVVVSLIIFHQETLPQLSTQNSRAYLVCDNTIMYLLPFLALGLAVLMVSRIRYPHILNQIIKGKKPFAHFIRVLLFLALITWSRQTALVLIFCGFAASGFVKWGYQRIALSRRNAKWRFKAQQEQSALSTE